MIQVIILLILFLTPTNLNADVKYSEKQDDFSNDKVYTLTITTEKEGNRFSGGIDDGVIFISCFPNNNIQIQFHTRDTIFPDSTTDNPSGMLVSITYKFDKAETSLTENWFMNTMKYQDAWYRGDKIKFIEHAAKSNVLNFRLNKTNDILKFKLLGTSTPIGKILKKCNARQQ